MMILNSRNNLFIFNFPKEFCPDDVGERYETYLNRIPGNLISKPIDFINYSVQTVNFPGASFDPVTQFGRKGERYYRDSKAMKEIVANDLNLSLQLLDGYINYWMMLDIFTSWYSFQEKDQFLPPGMCLRILDSEGNIIVTAEFKNVLFKEVSSLDMSFSNNTTEFSTFDIAFTYNWVEVRVELD